MKNHNSIAALGCIALAVTSVVNASQPRGFGITHTSFNPLIVSTIERNSTDEHGIFEKYDSNKNASERRERLDAFAGYLKENPHFQAYIMSYGGRRTYRGEAKSRGESAKRYLVKSKRIRATQITVIDAGYREDWVVELWYGVAGASSPAPLPTIDKKQVIMRSSRKFAGA